MSDPKILGVLHGCFASKGPVGAAARKYGVIAVVSSGLWAAAVAVLSVVVPATDLPENQGWIDLLMLGFAGIVVACGSLAGMSYASARQVEDKDAGIPGAPGASDVDMLEIRGRSLVVENRVGVDAWLALSGGNVSAQVPTTGAVAGATRHDGPALLSPLACAMKNISAEIACYSFVPFLVWPPDEGGVESLNPAAAAAELGFRHAGLCFISMHPDTDPEAHVNAAIFSVFDQNPALPMLLVVSADGPEYTHASSSDVTSNASALFLTKRDRIEKFIRPFAVDRTVAEEKYQAEPALNLFWTAKKELGSGKEEGLQLKAAVWRPKIEAVIAETPDQDFPGRSIFTPVPWRLRELHALDSTPCLGVISRSASMPVTGVKPGLALPGGLTLGQRGVSGKSLKPNDVQRALVDDMSCSGNTSRLIHDILNPSNSGINSTSKAVINMRSGAMNLGKGASLASLAYAAEATTSAGGATVVVHASGETLRFATIVPSS